MDMHFYWVRDRVQQKQFIIYWQPGAENMADYFTKHHLAVHHRQWRDQFVMPEHKSNMVSRQLGLRGCVNTLEVCTELTNNRQIKVKLPQLRSSNNNLIKLVMMLV